MPPQLESATIPEHLASSILSNKQTTMIQKQSMSSCGYRNWQDYLMRLYIHRGVSQILQSPSEGQLRPLSEQKPGKGLPGQANCREPIMEKVLPQDTGKA